MGNVAIFCLAVSVVTICHVVSENGDSGSPEVRVSASLSASARVTVTVNVSTGPPLEVAQISQTAGFIQTPGWGHAVLHPENMDSVVRVEVPENHTAMITVLHLNLTGQRNQCDRSKVTLVVYERNTTNKVWGCEARKPAARHHLPAGADLYVHFQSGTSLRAGFRLFFSVSEETTTLLRVGSDEWNCSVPNFADFKPHFPCDLTPQCLDKEDERDCPYFSDECGLGFVDLGEHCLVYESQMAVGTWRDAQLACSKRGGSLVNVKKPETYERLVRYLEPLADVWAFSLIGMGIHTASKSLPMMYRHELQHMDNTIAHYRSTEQMSTVQSACGAIILSDQKGFKAFISQYDKSYTKHLLLTFCTEQVDSNILCEFPKASTANAGRSVSTAKIQLRPILNPNISHLSLFDCPRGHVTRDFLACDVGSACWGSRDVGSCAAPLTPLPPSFACANEFESVPYTLVCDVRPDCGDGSDESFCEFPPCDLPEPFHCSDNECVPRSVVCDGQKTCYNAADEDLCSADRIGLNASPPPPAVVQLSRLGRFVVHKMNQSQQLADSSRGGGGGGGDVCPETHFQCLDNGYCMPAFLRCNGVYDCLGWEDEAGCDSYTCPGVYHCRGSQVCLHPHHLCDDIFQCPQNDDELLCDLSCPHNCTCYGLAFFCQQPFQARNFTKLRFLDGRKSGMSFSELTANVMLIYLSLAANRLTTIGEMNLPNLHSLDVSDNQLKEIHFQNFKRLRQLETVSLSGNPLLSLFQSFSDVGNGLTHFTRSPEGEGDVMTQLNDISQEFVSVTLRSKIIPAMLNTTSFPESSSGGEGHTSSNSSEEMTIVQSLRTLDLSRVKIKILNPSFLPLLSNLHTLNMSGCGTDTLLGEGFQALTQLRALDLRGCPLTYFPRHVFRGLQELQTVHSDNYKLCCPATLPAGFVLKNCYAPLNEISSCEALLRSNSYRVFLSVFASLALLGNISSFVYRVFVQKRKRLLSFDIFVAHLCIADCLMGVYLSTIGVADRMYQGTYLWEDNTWKTSTVCHAAGFLALLSGEVSALVICLITIDRFLVLRFPFSTFHFGAYSSQVASLCVWGVGCLIATIPSTHWAAHWQFYSQTGICIPLPISRADSPGYTYAFGVMIVANFIFFLVIAAGQFFIYYSVQTNSLSSTETTRKTQDLTFARRLITVAMSDFLCWFPIGVSGFLAATGTPISGEVNVAMAIFVLPFNSALNPFLYTLNILLEKRRKADTERIKDRLMAEFRSEDKSIVSAGFKN